MAFSGRVGEPMDIGGIASPSARTNGGGGRLRHHPLLAAHQTKSVSVEIHPLVTLLVADHYTRLRCQHQSQSDATPMGPIIGALLGKQDRGNIEITSAFELNFNVIEGDYILDVDYWKEKESQFKQVFVDTDYVGWYITDDDFLNERDLHMLRQVMNLHENPLLLKYRPSQNEDVHLDQFPFDLFESVVNVDFVKASSGNSRASSRPLQDLKFVQVPYGFAVDEAERIGVSGVAAQIVGDSNDASGPGAVAKTAKSLDSSTRMLASRLKVVVEYAKAVQRDELPEDSDMLARVKSIRDKLTVLKKSHYAGQGGYQADVSDSHMAALLGCVSQSECQLARFASDILPAYSARGPGSKGRKGRR